jgi:hypothetical protein
LAGTFAARLPDGHRIDELRCGCHSR